MTHKITKIGILAEKKIRYFILPQSLEHFRDILSFQAAQTWYLEKDAIIIGVGTRIEIWNKETWEKCDEEISADEIAENMANLGI